MKIFGKNGYFFRFAALLAAGLILLSAYGCSSGINTTRSVVTLNTISSASDSPLAHYCKSENALSVLAAESGLIQLYVDPESCSFCVLDTSGNQCWSALPLLTAANTANADISASMVSIDVLGGTDIYSLNSQDNSVEYSAASYKLIDNGVSFTYKLFPDEATAAKSKYDTSDIAFSVTMQIVLKDGSMALDCSYENLSKNPDACITNMNVLNYFGAFNQSEEGDFVLVPDGCGAIINTSVYDDSFEALEFPVYGSDSAVSAAESKSRAAVAAFGMKHSSSAFVALVTEGEAISTIYADKATTVNEYNVVNAGFCITPYVYQNEKLSVASKSYPSEEGIALCYRFVSGNNATYAGLASACREQLIRNAVLSTRNVAESDYLPLNLAVIGAAYDSITKNTGYLSIATDFEQALDMLTRMKNKGINSINLRYLGVFAGGTNQKDIASDNSPLLRLGSDGGLAELYDYMDSQKMRLFLNVNLLSSASGFSSSDSALNIFGKELKAPFANRLSAYVGRESFTRSLRTPQQLKSLVSTVLKKTRYYSFSGFCLDDIGSTLYSDYSHSVINRAEAAALISQALTPLTTNRTTMTAGGNFYTLKNSDVLVELPLDTYTPESGAYRSIPFIQLILHGSADYSGAPLNLSGDVEEAMLRYIEYGACPYYEWSYSELAPADTDVDFYYDAWINSAAEYYAKVNKALGDLRNARITDHSEVDDGVFLTEYDSGAQIYVNYTDKDYKTMGVVVGARDFIRVN